MIQTLYTGASGLAGQQKNIDVIANNVANITTDGFKKARFDFQDCLYQRMISPTDNSPEKNLQRGAGAIGYQTARIFLPGAMVETGRVLDVALEGRGFFKVENPAPQDDDANEGNIMYTRNGSFYLSDEANEGGVFLVDANGRYILDDGDQRIMVLGRPENISIGTDGMITMYDENGGEAGMAQLGIADFVNPGGLVDKGNGTYTAGENVGEILEAENPRVRQMYTESSNVDYAEEVTRMVRAQRAYQLAARCVTTADQMMQLANGIRQ